MDLPENEPYFPPLIVLIFLLIAIIFSSMIGSLLVALFCQLAGVDLEMAFGNLNSGSSPSNRNFVRTINFTNHLMTFAVPAILVAIFFYRRRWLNVLCLDKTPSFFNVFVGTMFILASFPFAQLTFWLNQQLPIPGWAQSMEKTAESLVNNLLIMNSPGELLFNLVLVAVLPAIGEELVFRGIIQQKIEEKYRNGHLAIWATAFFFSVMHLQFEGLFPRMILGAVLGYIFYWTRNLWIPVIAHFIINALQVLAKYYYTEQFQKLDINGVSEPKWVVGLLSLCILIVIGHILWKHNYSVFSSKG